MYILLKYSSFRHEADVNYDIIQTHNGFQIYWNSFVLCLYIRVYTARRGRIVSPATETAAAGAAATRVRYIPQHKAARRRLIRLVRVEFNPNIILQPRLV